MKPPLGSTRWRGQVVFRTARPNAYAKQPTAISSNAAAYAGLVALLPVWGIEPVAVGATTADVALDVVVGATADVVGSDVGVVVVVVVVGAVVVVVVVVVVDVVASSAA